MDASDHRLMDMLQRDARTSVARLSEATGLSTASVQRRLRRLREDGLIRGEVAVLDPEKLGFGITAIVLVELERDRLDRVDAFKRRAAADPNVQSVYCVAGEVDFVLTVVARDIKDYEAFTRRTFLRDDNIRRFRTNIVVTTEKATLSLPI
ncbi:MAG: Lrp/AsnC family transcriptional regulator [Pseudomonadota bacterium]